MVGVRRARVLRLSLHPFLLPFPASGAGLGYKYRLRIEDYTHRLQSSSFLGIPYRILNANHKNEL